MACSFIEKETPAQMFYMNFAKFFRIKYLRANGSDLQLP